MSLLFDEMEKFVFLEKRRAPDGASGFITTWENGAEFDAVLKLSQSLETAVAQAQGVKGVYTAYVRNTVDIDYHDAFKRLNDNKTFRCVSLDDTVTPKMSSLNIRTFRAEEWVPS